MQKTTIQAALVAAAMASGANDTVCMPEQCLITFGKLQDRSYTVTDDPLVFSFADISTDECPFSYSFEVKNDLKITPSIKLKGRTFTVENRHDVSLARHSYKDYEIDVIASLGANCEKARGSFKLRVVNPCISEKFVKIVDTSGFGLDALPYEVGSGEISYTIDASNFQIRTSPIEHDFCGPLRFKSRLASYELDSDSWPMSFEVLQGDSGDALKWTFDYE